VATETASAIAGDESGSIEYVSTRPRSCGRFETRSTQAEIHVDVFGVPFTGKQKLMDSGGRAGASSVGWKGRRRLPR
jgi:hypothetical protein